LLSLLYIGIVLLLVTIVIFVGMKFI